MPELVCILTASQICDPSTNASTYMRFGKLSDAADSGRSIILRMVLSSKDVRSPALVFLSHV
jgi:hypothetical protein